MIYFCFLAADTQPTSAPRWTSTTSAPRWTSTPYSGQQVTRSRTMTIPPNPPTIPPPTGTKRPRPPSRPSTPSSKTDEPIRCPKNLFECVQSKECISPKYRYVSHQESYHFQCHIQKHISIHMY